ncbi:M56 family metallopeptidase [Nocardia sp. NPDC005978]|uniref:M56 family metallopeptidase n=1 Tax=Nocardia sp. NPDC005978 TaxID=3156725 RepID=UPI0033A01ABC
MIVITALLAAGFALAIAGPRVLARIDFSAAPRIGMAAWLGAIAAVMGSAVLVLIALAWQGDPPGERAAKAVARSLAALEPLVITWTAGLIMPVVLIGMIVPTGQLARIAIGHRGRETALRRRHSELIEILGRADPAGARLVRLDHPIPLAYSVAGRGGYVVVTDGLARCLTDAQWRAVLAHENAHLRGFHHHILGACQILARAFGWVPLFTAAPAAMATLLELAADRTAANSTDPQSLYTALRTVAAHTAGAPAGRLGLIDADLATRLECLAAAPESRSAARCTAAAMLVATLSLAPLAAVVAVGSITGLVGLIAA